MAPKVPIHRYIPAVLAAVIAVALGVQYLRILKPSADREVKAACRGMWPAETNARLGDLPTRAPEFQAQDQGGALVSLADLKGKTTLVNFWASWCQVCKAEKPSLIELTQSMGKELNIITLASDSDWEQIKKMYPDGPPFKVLLDPPVEGNLGPIARAYGITAVPESFIVGKDGLISHYFINRRNWSTALAQTCLESLL